jgi:hypothetical protein
MSELFTQVADNLTEEQKMNIIKNKGVLKSGEKHPEEKTYCVIFRSYLRILLSQLAEDDVEISGEAIIVSGRYNCFARIKEYLNEDAELAVDIRNSLVMVEGVDASSAVSLYRFIVLCNKAYPDEAIDESILNQYLKGFNDEEEIKSNVTTTGNGNYCGTLLREEID